MTGRDKVSAGGDVGGRDKVTAQQGSAAAGEGGIASVGDGNVNIVGGQGPVQVVKGDVGGDVVRGDKVSGDKTTVGDISDIEDSAIAVGPGVTATLFF